MLSYENKKSLNCNIRLLLAFSFCYSLIFLNTSIRITSAINNTFPPTIYPANFFPDGLHVLFSFLFAHNCDKI